MNKAKEMLEVLTRMEDKTEQMINILLNPKSK